MTPYPVQTERREETWENPENSTAIPRHIAVYRAIDGLIDATKQFDALAYEIANGQQPPPSPDVDEGGGEKYSLAEVLALSPGMIETEAERCRTLVAKVRDLLF